MAQIYKILCSLIEHNNKISKNLANRNNILNNINIIEKNNGIQSISNSQVLIDHGELNKNVIIPIVKSN